jgi:hypothetical protein
MQFFLRRDIREEPRNITEIWDTGVSGGVFHLIEVSIDICVECVNAVECF